MISSFELLLNDAIKQVVDAISRHERNEEAPLSIHALAQVKKELEEMIRVMNPKVYIPAYPRFIIDWPGEDSLIRELVHIAALYEKNKEKLKKSEVLLPAITLAVRRKGKIACFNPDTDRILVSNLPPFAT